MKPYSFHPQFDMNERTRKRKEEIGRERERAIDPNSEKPTGDPKSYAYYGCCKASRKRINCDESDRK